MCFKLDNGSELFSVQDMHRLRKKASGAMGSRAWVETAPAAGSCSGHGLCSCAVKCAQCACREGRPERTTEAEAGHACPGN